MIDLFNVTVQDLAAQGEVMVRSRTLEPQNEKKLKTSLRPPPPPPLTLLALEPLHLVRSRQCQATYSWRWMVICSAFGVNRPLAPEMNR